MANIATEDAAFSLLEKILAEEAIPTSINFEGWPELSITLTGERFNGTVTPHVMRGLLDFQSSIYRSYATAKYGLPDARRLTEEERQELEISVHVEEGSSILGIDFESIIEKLIEQVGGRMTPAELMSLVIVLALIWSGKTLVSKFLNDRKEIALKKLDEGGRAELVGALIALNQEDKRKLRIFANAINENSRIATAAAVAQDGQADLLKGLADADSVEIQGHVVAGEALRHMARNARRKAVEINLEGLYMIRRVDTSDPLMTRVKVQDISDRSEVDANVQDDMLSLRKKNALQNAEWNRHPVKLSISAKMLDDEVRDAVVTEVEELSEQELALLSRSGTPRS